MQPQTQESAGAEQCPRRLQLPLGKHTRWVQALRPSVGQALTPPTSRYRAGRDSSKPRGLVRGDAATLPPHTGRAGHPSSAGQGATPRPLQRRGGGSPMEAGASTACLTRPHGKAKGPLSHSPHGCSSRAGPTRLWSRLSAKPQCQWVPSVFLFSKEGKSSRRKTRIKHLKIIAVY